MRMGAGKRRYPGRGPGPLPADGDGRARIDMLIPVSAREGKHREEKEDFRKKLRKEREFLSSMDEAWEHIDESCEGGG